MGTPDTQATTDIKRGQTALKRFSCSRPVALAFADGLIPSDSGSFFDYGCGHGADIAYLRKKGVRTDGWDPIHRSKTKPKQADVVNLGYVLNVIEDPAERLKTLQKAFQLARNLLIVSVRVDREVGATVPFADGHVTSRGTFQKLFSQSEFREYVETSLGRRLHFAGLGIAYVFRDEEAEARYLANLAFTRRLSYRTELIETFRKDKTAKKLVKVTTELARLPLEEEFSDYSELRERYGSLQRIQRLVLRQIDPVAYEGSQAQHREDILTYLSMIRLQGLKAPPAKSLPPDVYADIRNIWGNYDAARTEADEFLFRIGDPDAVGAACESAGIGKLVNDHLYVHRSAEDDLPSLLRLIVFAGKQIVGDTGYNLVKLWLDGRKVSFLTYNQFDRIGHPALQHSVQAYLPKADYGIRDFSESENPPILHRKETFVLSTYPGFEKFRSLTVREEKLGLLSQAGIGHRQQWKDVLEGAGVRVAGHTIRRVRTSVK